MKFASPVPKFALDSAAAGLMWKNGAYDFWGRGSFMRKVFGAGCTYRMQDNLTFSNELLFDMKDGKGNGIMGSPMFWKFGATHKSSNVTIEHRLAAANKALMYSSKSSFPIDQNTKFTLSIQEDIPSWFIDRKAGYDKLKFGFALEYKV